MDKGTKGLASEQEQPGTQAPAVPGDKPAEVPVPDESGSASGAGLDDPATAPPLDDAVADATEDAAAAAEDSADSAAGEEPGAEPPIWSTPATVPISAPQPGSGDTTAVVAGAPTGNRRSALLRPRNLILAGVAAAAVASAAIFGPVAWELWSEKDVRIATPAHVAGLALDDSQGAHDTIDYLRTAIETGVSLRKTTGAVYADDAGQSRSVLFVGGTGVLVSPEEALNKTFGLITDDAGGVESVHAVPAGSLGGVMKCGTTKTDGGTMAVCGWADHGSLGIAMFPNRTVDQSADLLRTMRKAIQNRG